MDNNEKKYINGNDELDSLDALCAILFVITLIIGLLVGGIVLLSMTN